MNLFPESKNKLLNQNWVVNQDEDQHEECFLGTESENNFLSKEFLSIEPNEAINVRNLKLEKLVGRGNFGNVVTVNDLKQDKKYAVKKIEMIKNNENFKELVRYEMKISKCLKHENIIETYITYMSENSSFIVMEFCEKGNLSDFLNQNFPLNENLIERFSREMVSSVKYLHHQTIAHLDIKPQNFLLDKSLRIKLCDFGFSKYVTDRCSVRSGTPIYSAPQVALRDYNPFKADVWSFGVSFYLMVSGKLPFLCTKWERLSKLSDSSKPKYPQMIPEKMKDLIENMLVYDEEKRFDINQVAKHEWFDLN